MSTPEASKRKPDDLISCISKIDAGTKLTNTNKGKHSALHLVRTRGMFFRVHWFGCKLLIRVDQVPDRARESLLSILMAAQMHSVGKMTEVTGSSPKCSRQAKVSPGIVFLAGQKG